MLNEVYYALTRLNEAYYALRRLKKLVYLVRGAKPTNEVQTRLNMSTERDYILTQSPAPQYRCIT